MTVDELRAEAKAVQAKGHAYMIMVMHRSAEPRGGTVRLRGRGRFPVTIGYVRAAFPANATFRYGVPATPAPTPTTA